MKQSSAETKASARAVRGEDDLTGIDELLEIVGRLRRAIAGNSRGRQGRLSGRYADEGDEDDAPVASRSTTGVWGR